MKENLYAKHRSLTGMITRTLLISAAFLATLSISAQQQSAQTIRNLNSSAGKKNSTATVGNVMTIKTLSTLPGVSPGENAVSQNNSGNRNNLYSPSSSNTVGGTNSRTISMNSSLENTGLLLNTSSSTPSTAINGSTSVNKGTYDNNGVPMDQANSGNILLSNTVAKLSSFTGASANGEYRLAWETVIENDVKQYEVEYSINDKDYQGAGIVNATNSSVYNFNHITDGQATMYYRLKVVDSRGGVSYTNSLIVKNSMVKAADHVAPTIIRDGVLNMTLANSYKNVQLFNSAGIEVFREYLGGRTGNRIGFYLPSLPAGTYFVKLIGTNTSVTQRVMIM